MVAATNDNIGMTAPIASERGAHLLKNACPKTVSEKGTVPFFFADLEKPEQPPTVVTRSPQANVEIGPNPGGEVRL
jgi:hypothetical protein